MVEISLVVLLGHICGDIGVGKGVEVVCPLQGGNVEDFDAFSEGVGFVPKRCT
jgi:hypothetical protein